MVLALGGGTVIDGAKAIAAVAPGRHHAADFLRGQAAAGESTLPIVAMPTTAGTGSELNRSAIMTDPRSQLRDGIRSDWLFPRVAIVDAALTCSLDRLHTAITGFDCLSHAVESYVSPRARPDTDRLARQAMRLVCRYLPDALADPADIEARAQLARASTTMGINLSCVGTCYPHRVDKAICALYPHIPHGQSVALLYPHWIAMSQVGSPAKFADVAEILDPRTAMLPVEDRAASLPAIMQDFLERLKLNRTPEDCGIAAERIADIAAGVRGDLAVNPVPIERRSLPDLLGQVLQRPRRQAYKVCYERTIPIPR
jgi:alcohol dehydrogenase class IV